MLDIDLLQREKYRSEPGRIGYYLQNKIFGFQFFFSEEKIGIIYEKIVLLRGLGADDDCDHGDNDDNDNDFYVNILIQSILINLANFS